MSGRSGYRKTDRKRNRNTAPRPRPDYVLRFQLPPRLAAFLTSGQHGFGVTVGYNDVVFVSGQSPAHCCQLAADFLDKIAQPGQAQTIAATAVKLLPCSAHCGPAFSPGLKPLHQHVDIEAIHDRVSRFADRARAISIDIGADGIAFAGEGWPFRFVHDFIAGGTGRQAR